MNVTKNVRWVFGSLKKVPTIFKLELVKILFIPSNEYISISNNEIITIGTSLNITSVTKRGTSKSSILKQIEVINKQLGIQYNESFHFKASLFYDNTNKCIQKIFRLNINHICRSDNNQHEFITTCIGYVIIDLNEHANTGKTNFHLPIIMENNNITSYKGELEINLSIISNLEDSLLDDTSSIGSDLSFIQKESASPRKQTTSLSSSSNSNRIVGGMLPEAGKSNWSFNATTQLQQETEVKLTELSILKMHLDHVTVEKENLESIQKEHLKEIKLLQNEIKQLKLQRVENLTLQGLSLNSENTLPLNSLTLLQSQSSSQQSSLSLEKTDENVKLSIDYMLQLQQENKELRDNLTELQLKYQQLLESKEVSTNLNDI